MSTWTLPIDQWVSAQKDKINTVRRIFAFDVFKKIVLRTPVDIVTPDDATDQTVLWSSSGYFRYPAGDVCPFCPAGAKRAKE